mgnify:CR=1 FL=1
MDDLIVRALLRLEGQRGQAGDIIKTVMSVASLRARLTPEMLLIASRKGRPRYVGQLLLNIRPAAGCCGWLQLCVLCVGWLLLVAGWLAGLKVVYCSLQLVSVVLWVASLLRRTAGAAGRISRLCHGVTTCGTKEVGLASLPTAVGSGAPLIAALQAIQSTFSRLLQVAQYPIPQAASTGGAYQGLRQVWSEEL